MVIFFSKNKNRLPKQTVAVLDGSVGFLCADNGSVLDILINDVDIGLTAQQLQGAAVGFLEGQRLVGAVKGTGTALSAREDDGFSALIELEAVAGIAVDAFYIPLGVQNHDIIDGDLSTLGGAMSTVVFGSADIFPIQAVFLIIYEIAVTGSAVADSDLQGIRRIARFDLLGELPRNLLDLFCAVVFLGYAFTLEICVGGKAMVVFVGVFGTHIAIAERGIGSQKVDIHNVCSGCHGACLGTTACMSKDKAHGKCHLHKGSSGAAAGAQNGRNAVDVGEDGQDAGDAAFGFGLDVQVCLVDSRL